MLYFLYAILDYTNSLLCCLDRTQGSEWCHIQGRTFQAIGLDLQDVLFKRVFQHVEHFHCLTLIRP